MSYYTYTSVTPPLYNNGTAGRRADRRAGRVGRLQSDTVAYWVVMAEMGGQARGGGH